jgi:hypothetical protein
MDPWQTQATVRHLQRMLASYAHWTGRSLLADLDAEAVDSSADAIARVIFELPCVVVAHGPGPDPVFVYANHSALTLWELDWEGFMRLPSRRSADAAHVEERSRWLAAAAANGYVTGCHGERVSATGKRFIIEDVTIWNVTDEAGAACGQAAAYRSWRHCH